MDGVLLGSFNRIRRFFNSNPDTVVMVVAATAIEALNITTPGTAISCVVVQEFSNRVTMPYINRAVEYLWNRFFPSKSAGVKEVIAAIQGQVAIADHHSRKEVLIVCGVNAIAFGLVAATDVFRRCVFIDIPTYTFWIIPSVRKEEQCGWDHKAIVLCTVVFVLNGVTLLICKRRIGRQETRTNGLAKQAAFNTAIIGTHTTAIQLISSTLSVTKQRIDSHEKELRKLKRLCKDIVRQLENDVAAMFDQIFSNVGIQTILEDPGKIVELYRSQRKKDAALEEQKYIKARPHLQKYYHELCQRLNGTYMACLVIRSGLVGTNPVQNLDDYLRVAVESFHLPGMGIITGILGAAQSARKTTIVNRLCHSFGSNLMRDFKHLERLARYLTIEQKKNLANPAPLKLAQAAFHAVKDEVVDDDGGDPVIHKARKDCGRFFEKVLEGELDFAADPSLVLNILIERSRVVASAEPAKLSGFYPKPVITLQKFPPEQ